MAALMKKTQFLLLFTVLVFFWLIVTCSARGLPGSGEFTMHGNFMTMKRKMIQVSRKEYKGSTAPKMDDSKSTVPGHSPGIGHAG
ncbi:hypothetical protein ABFS83_08G047900 [Erythranthe nasuta]